MSTSTELDLSKYPVGTKLKLANGEDASLMYSGELPSGWVQIHRPHKPSYTCLRLYNGRIMSYSTGDYDVVEVVLKSK